MVLARLEGIEGRMGELLGRVQEIGRRCMSEHASVAAIRAELRAVREKTNLNSRVIWGAVAWIVVTALGLLGVLLKGSP
jgi:hypothetical protein